MKTKCLQIIAVAEMFALPQIRDPLTYVVIFAFPGVILYFFWLMGGMQLGQHVLFGSLVALPMNAGIVSLPQILVAYRYRRLQEMYVASPVTQFIYLAGTGLARLLFAIPGTVFIASLLIWGGYLPLRAIPTVVIVVILSWAVGCALGFTLANHLHNVTLTSEIANLVGWLMVMLPPVSYPLELLAPRWRSLALTAPSASAAYLIKIASGISSATHKQLISCWLVLVGFSSLFLWLSISKSQWREE